MQTYITPTDFKGFRSQEAYISRAHLKGYRNIQDTTATFVEGLNIIIGPNGCGKSNFLWLLANIDKEDTNKLKISAKIELKTLDEKVNTVEVFHERVEHNRIEKKIIYNDKKNYSFRSERRLLSFNIPNPIECFSQGHTMSVDRKFEENMGSYYFPDTQNFLIKNLFLTKIEFQNFPNIQPPQLNFEQYTIYILKKYTPIEDIRVETPTREDEIKLINEDEIRISNLMYGFKINNEWFKWNELSDGTRRIVWIVLNVLLGYPGEIVLIEEPELGIHPHQLFKLMEFLKEESKVKQIIITTHSPEVLDIVDENELNRIQIARYDTERKTTIIEPLSERKIASIQRYFKEEGLLSSYWSNIGLEPKPKNNKI